MEMLNEPFVLYIDVVDNGQTMSKEKYGIETDSMTLQRFVLAEQRRYPEATGDLTNLLTSLLTAFKVQFHSQ
ncbi:hypothetical protein ANCCEY_13553 [Ancylostoma ceylanicum]|uniref:Uncharacterized protein n=1 Tax=Ancylostoma ceylanicum TaxID=53326 RepID=A0A0D6L7A1_9BILA|nr:hypothetical protein ANCCEY_13553 [Ancylostoma ceylanicum]